MGDAKGGEQSVEFQEHRILPGANNVREHCPGVMVKRMPQPPRPLFGPDETPHFIYRGSAFCRNADGTRTRRLQRGVGVLQHGAFFLLWR
jgi:hypothetical protein